MAGIRIRHHAAVGALAVFALLAGPLAERADAQQRIGADLSRPAQNSFDCTVVPPFGAPGAGTCTYVGFTATGEYVQTPFGGGVWTRVRVKTGNTTGPMRITVARAFRSFQGPACCFFQGQSQVFTPRAGRISSVNVRLPAENSFDPSFGETIDYLGITVLAPGVAIPGWLDNSGGAFSTHSSGFTPHISPADAANGRVDGSGTNLLPLINADFVPLCGQGGGAGAERRREVRRAQAAAGRCLGGVTPRNGGLKGSKAKVPIDCNLTGRCSGKIQLRAKRGGAKLGDSRFKIASGDRKRIGIKLSRKGRRKAKGRRKLAVKAKTKVRGGPNGTTKIKLKR